MAEEKAAVVEEKREYTKTKKMDDEVFRALIDDFNTIKLGGKNFPSDTHFFGKVADEIRRIPTHSEEYGDGFMIKVPVSFKYKGKLIEGIFVQISEGAEERLLKNHPEFKTKILGRWCKFAKIKSSMTDDKGKKSIVFPQSISVFKAEFEPRDFVSAKSLFDAVDNETALTDTKDNVSDLAREPEYDYSAYVKTYKEKIAQYNENMKKEEKEGIEMSINDAMSRFKIAYKLEEVTEEQKNGLIEAFTE